MVDYHSLINRAVAELDPGSVESRRALFERARAEQIKLLRNLDPPVTEGDFGRERLALEDAIRRIENDAKIGDTLVPPPTERDQLLAKITAALGRPSMELQHALDEAGSQTQIVKASQQTTFTDDVAKPSNGKNAAQKLLGLLSRTGTLKAEPWSYRATGKDVALLGQVLRKNWLMLGIWGVVMLGDLGWTYYADGLPGFGKTLVVDVIATYAGAYFYRRLIIERWDKTPKSR